MNTLIRVNIGKITRDRHEYLTIPKMQEIYGPYLDIIAWLEDRNCKIEFEHYAEAMTYSYVDVIIAFMDEPTWVEYRLTWK